MFWLQTLKKVCLDSPVFFFRFLVLCPALCHVAFIDDYRTNWNKHGGAIFSSILSPHASSRTLLFLNHWQMTSSSASPNSQMEFLLFCLCLVECNSFKCSSSLSFHDCFLPYWIPLVFYRSKLRLFWYFISFKSVTVFQVQKSSEATFILYALLLFIEIRHSDSTRWQGMKQD